MTSDPSVVATGLSRRRFLWLSSATVAGFALGCAVNPVTGEKQLMLISEEEEIQIDRQYAPAQFSNDYGVTQEASLNQYVSQVGKRVAAITHRPQMPYNFQTVNATYVNAYAFPGGSIAVTRGILLKLEDEDELAALLGHELGHVNARHTAEQMSKGQVTSLVVGGLAAVVGASTQYGDIANMLGSVGASLLLASYSRDNERQADDLGNRYMVQAGYNTQGFVGLMEMLNSMHKTKPGYAEVLFSTHPMSDERYETALQNAKTTYQSSQRIPLVRDRYMDNISRLRAISGAIDELQKGETAVGKKQYDQAATHYRNALKIAPRDYAGNVMMAKCQILMDQPGEALRYANAARSIYPREAQAHEVAGFANLKTKQYQAAYRNFNDYDRLLPGNPAVTFYKGFSAEGMGRRQEAAQAYAGFLKVVKEGPQAQHAYKRLVEWGYIKPQ